MSRLPTCGYKVPFARSDAERKKREREIMGKKREGKKERRRETGVTN